MPMRKQFRQIVYVWRRLRKNPQLRWAYARMRTSRDNRNVLKVLTAKLELPGSTPVLRHKVRALYEKLEPQMGRKRAVDETVRTMQEIDQLAEALNLYSNNWVQMHIRSRPIEAVLEDLQNQAKQVGLAAAA